jgi:putative SOS response-associated peptidase YedK
VAISQTQFKTDDVPLAALRGCFIAGSGAYERRANGSRRPQWTALGPLDLQCAHFGFLTTEANAVVAPIHPKAMPTTPDEFDQWLEADILDALALQRPLADDALRIVAVGEKEDPPAESRLFA